MTNHYQILGVATNATAEQIKAAYREYAKHYHPDKHANNDFFKRRFQDVQNAYEVLSDDGKRAMFDRQQTTGQQANGQSKSTYDATVTQLNVQITKLKNDLAIKERLASDAAKSELLLSSKVKSLEVEVSSLKSNYVNASDAEQMKSDMLDLKFMRAVLLFLLLIASGYIASGFYKKISFFNNEPLINMSLVGLRVDTLANRQDYTGIMAFADSLMRTGTEVDSTIKYKGTTSHRYDILVHRAYGKALFQNDTGAVRDLTLNILSRKVQIAYPYYMRSVVKRKLGDYTGARADIDQAIIINPNDLESRVTRAAMLYNVQDYAGALIDYRAASRLDSKNAEVVTSVGDCFRMINRVDSACVMWRIAGDLGSKAAFDNMKIYCK